MTLVPVDPTSAPAVTDYLTKARDWLATAVENTGPEQIAAAKAEIATAAEAAKQLGLSKEIQSDAREMVRRAEWTLRKSQQKAQAAGEIRSRETNLVNQDRSAGSDTSTLPSPRDFFASTVEYRDSLDMGRLDPEEFDQVLEQAKAEDNLSRANVARLAREKAGLERRQPQRRKPLPDAARDAGWELRKAVERLQRIAADDRFTANKEQMAPHLRSHLENAVEVCQDLLARIN